MLSVSNPRVRMLALSADRLGGQRGFTLIELLVVILIIGILAAIALPAFLGQKVKGQDSSAKSNARNLVSQVESCYATTQDYQQCNASDTGMDLGGLSLTGNEAVTVTGNATGYVITAKSKSGNSFSISKSGTAVTRSCTTVAAGSKGGCNASGW